MESSINPGASLGYKNFTDAMSLHMLRSLRLIMNSDCNHRLKRKKTITHRTLRELLARTKMSIIFNMQCTILVHLRFQINTLFFHPSDLLSTLFTPILSLYALGFCHWDSDGLFCISLGLQPNFFITKANQSPYITLKFT